MSKSKYKEIDFLKPEIKPINKYEFVSNELRVQFPIDIFPEGIKDLLLMLEEISQFETQVTASTLLFVVSTILGNSAKINVKKTWVDTPNIWIAIIGKPGTMKTPSTSFMLMPLKKAESEYNNEFQSRLADYYSIPKKDRQEHLKPKRMQRYSNDPTVEGLISAMMTNANGMGIYKDELNGFFEEMNRYNSGGNKEFYLSAFSGGQYIKNRASYDPITIDNIFLSILGSIQPELLKKLSVGNISNGMIDRWLYVESDNVIPMFSDSDIPKDIINSYMEFIKSIETWIPEKDFIWNEDAKLRFYLVVNEIGDKIKNDQTSERLGTYLSKMRTYFARFIVILCAMYKNNQISIEFVYAAEQLINYFIRTAENTFINFSNENEIELVFKRSDAVSKNEKVTQLLTQFPDMSKAMIAEKIGCSRDYVYKIAKNV